MPWVIAAGCVAVTWAELALNEGLQVAAMFFLRGLSHTLLLAMAIRKPVKNWRESPRHFVTPTSQTIGTMHSNRSDKPGCKLGSVLEPVTSAEDTVVSIETSGSQQGHAARQWAFAFSEPCR